MSSQTSNTIFSNFLDGEAAERYKNAEKATRHFAKIIVQKSGIAQCVESGDEVRVLDFACGTGAVIQEVYDSVPKEKWGQLKVTGTDFSPAMLEYLDKRGEREGWAGLDTKVVDGNDDFTKSLPASTYTHIFISFAIFGMSSYTLQRLQTLLRPNGFIAVTSWVTMPWHPILSHSISLMSPPQPYSPTANELKEKFCGNWNSESYVIQQLQEAGFPDASVMVDKHKARLGSPDSFMVNMQFPLGMVVKTWWDETGRNEKLQELNSIMGKVVAESVGESGEAELEFEGIMGWGWKSA